MLADVLGLKVIWRLLAQKILKSYDVIHDLGYNAELVFLNKSKFEMMKSKYIRANTHFTTPFLPSIPLDLRFSRVRIIISNNSTFKRQNINKTVSDLYFQIKYML